MTSSGNRFMQFIGGAAGAKKARLGANETAGESSTSLAGSRPAGSPSVTTATRPSTAPQSRSFAQVVGASAPKRSGPAPPAFPRPSLVRGKPLLKHENYDSMERPAPKTPAPNVLYVDMRSSSLSPEEVLEAAFPVLGEHVLGFQLFAAQKTLGLVFASSESRAHYAGQSIGDTGLRMHAAPSDPVNLLKLTLLGVPFWDVKGVTDALPALLRPYGELVFLAPMVTPSGWTSDQWHATIARAPGNDVLPPEVVEVLGQPVIVDVPGTRRYCRHCESSVHIKPSCRQGTRFRSRQNQLAKDLAAVAAAKQQQQPQHPDQQHHQQTPQQQPPPHQSPLSQQQHQPPHQPRPRQPNIPENWEDEDAPMDTVPTASAAEVEHFRRATVIVTACAQDPNAYSAEILAAAQEYIATATRSGGATQ